MNIKAQQKRLYSDVEFLTELRPFRNYQNLASLEKVCDYLKQEIHAAGLQSRVQQWEASGNIYKNVIASYNSGAKKRLVLGAHYDVCGDQPGADDNASAVAGLLETMRLIVENQPDLDYRIDFVFYCLEEPPFFGSELMGSYVHAKSLKEQNVDVMGMICYEMIGYFSDKPNSQSVNVPDVNVEFPSVGNFLVVVGIREYRSFSERFHQLMADGSKVDIRIINFPSPFGAAGLSDQSNYWRFGYPALMLNDTSFLRNPNYHEPTDTIDTLDFEKLTEVVNSAYRAIVRLD
ncbi:MAG: M28 family peptidase [Calditrichia bacterium]